MFKVWVKIRDAKTLEVVKTELLFKDDDRLTAEKFIERVHKEPPMPPTAPGLMRTIEMEIPAMSAMREMLDTTFRAESERAGELVRVTNERDGLSVQCQHWAVRVDELMGERDQLRAKLEALRANFASVRHMFDAESIG